MRPESNKSVNLQNREGGFSLVVVIFILLILAFMAGSVSSILAVTHRSSLDYLNATQAFYLSQAGLAWAMKNQKEILVPISFGQGTFSVEKYYFRYIATGTVGGCERKVRGYRSIEYLQKTRYALENEDAGFWLKNQTGDWVELWSFRAEWAGTTAFFAKLFHSDDGEAFNAVYDKAWYGKQNGSSGVKYAFPSSIWIAPGQSVLFYFDDFKSGPFGGSDVDMRQIPFKFTLYGNWFGAEIQFPPTVVGVN